MQAFKLASTTARAPMPTPIHMERFWDDHGPVTMCGIRPPKRDRQTMTDAWESATCRACLRSKPVDTGASPATEPGMKRRYIKLPPELADGQNSTFHRVGDEHGPWLLGESLETWLEHASPGETIELKVVEMTDAQWEALPEI